MKMSRIFTSLFLALALVLANVSSVVSAQSQTVDHVTSTTLNGTYTTGAVIHITITFSAAVTVAGGTPSLTLETGTTDRSAIYTSGSTTNTLTFDYTVQAGDTSSDLDYVDTTSLILNGATIRDGSDVDADLTLPTPGSPNSLGGSKAIVIDTTPPTVTFVLEAGSDTGSSSTDNLTNATTITIDAIFNEPILGLVPGDLVNTGTATGCTFFVGGPTANTYPIVVLNCSGGTLIVTLAAGGVTDAAGNGNALTDGLIVTIDRTAPVYSGVAPATNAFINSITASSDVGYTLSETIANGTITMTRASGASDSGSPHVCTLVGTALTSGVHANVDLSNTTNGCSVAQSLVNGAVYSFAFNGTDAAGNSATTFTSANVTFDTTAPIFSAVAPASNASIGSITTNSAVSYTLSEALASGTITMTRTSGTNDAGSPHICTLVGTALASGVHSGLDLSNTTNGCTVAQSLVNGGVYTFAFNGVDAAGNAAATVTSTNVSFDTSAPVFSAVAPVSNAFIKSITTSSAVSYTLSKALASGTITMTWTSGTSDPGSPHVCTLVGTGLASGVHTGLDLSNTSNGCSVAQTLVNGAVYTFAFNGIDSAGNSAVTVTSTNVTFDTTAPVFSAVAPVSNASIGSITTNSAVSYTLSEALASGTITMTRTGGTNDAGSPHICTLVGTALASGVHSGLDLSNTTNGCTVAQSLVNGGVYTFAFNGVDAAGNAAATVTSTNVSFDTVAPAFSAVAPVSNAFIKSITTSSAVSYTLSKALASGTITMTWTSGTADSGSPHVCTLVGTALASGVHTGLDLSNTSNGCSVAQSLVSGAVYTFAFNGLDSAGNAAPTVTSTNVTFDTTAPVFSAVAPVANAFIKSITTASAVSYTLSEALASGTITMIRTGGTTDAGSPHVCTLTGTALTIGAHNHLDLSDITNGCTVAQSLVSGGIYTFTFNGVDKAGNAAAIVTSLNVTFDNTAPVLSNVSPATNALISNITTNSAVSYTLNEAVASGSITMTRTGGSTDSGSPHICTLVGTALSSGVHTRLDLSNTTNGCIVAQSLVNGGVYTFTFNATDVVGFSAATVTSTNVSYDTTPPVFSAVSPAANSYIKSITTSSGISYTLSKAVTSGSITMTRTGGAADAGSPHICALTGTALGNGAHTNLDLSNTTDGCTVAQSLISGTVYTFAFNATDAAGNPATTITRANVTFDNAAPVISAVLPGSNSYINNISTASDVSYTLSEAIASGTITFTRIGGSTDSASPHICTLIGTALTIGAHTNFDLTNVTNGCSVAQTLMSGTVYSLAFDATDPVGFTASTVTISNVTYDKTYPTVSWNVPVNNAERYDVANQFVQLTVDASDNIGVAMVVFSRWDYDNSVRIEIGRVTSPPYTITFYTGSLLPQYNEIDAKAYDLADNATLKYIWLYHLPVLSVVRSGPGNGKVTSSPAGIDCGLICSYGFNYDPNATPPVPAATVTLTATPISPSTFAGWGGACSGTGTCTVTMDQARSVTAYFSDPRLRIFIPLLIR